MPSTNKTQRLGLNNWIEDDPPRREDFNNDNLKVDAWANSINPAGTTVWNSQNFKKENKIWEPKLEQGIYKLSHAAGRVFTNGNLSLVFYDVVIGEISQAGTGAVTIIGVPVLTYNATGLITAIGVEGKDMIGYILANKLLYYKLQYSDLKVGTRILGSCVIEQ